MRKWLARLCTLLGVLLLLTSAGLALHNVKEDQRSSAACAEVMEQIMAIRQEKQEGKQPSAAPEPETTQASRETEETQANDQPEETEEAEKAEETEETREPEELPEIPDIYDPTMTEVLIYGYPYIGYLSVPDLELALPIISEWSYPRFQIAPCRVSGTVLEKNLVLGAHNYPSHFGRLSQLSRGADIYFTDMDDNAYHYQVADIEILQPNDIDLLTAGEYPLTLFTCTYGGKTRVTIRCDFAD